MLNHSELIDLVRDEEWKLLEDRLFGSSVVTQYNHVISALQKCKWEMLQKAPLSIIRSFMQRCYPNRCNTDYDILVRLISDCSRNPLSRCCKRVNVLHRVVKLFFGANSKLSFIQDASQFVLLHHVCLKRPYDVDLIHWLIDSNPHSVSMTDKVGRTPIHLFCSVFTLEDCYFEKYLDVVLALAQADLDTLHLRCVSGRIPLHVYLDRDVIIDHRIVRVLSTASIKDDKKYSKFQGVTLVEYYWLKSQEKGNVDERVLKVLLEECSTLKCDTYAAGVIHAVLRLDGKYIMLLEFLLRHFRSDAMIYYNGQLPLHYILSHNSESKCVWFELYFQAIIDAYPSAVNMIDHRNNLYPFMMATVVFSSINICYALLMKDPHIVYSFVYV